MKKTQKNVNEALSFPDLVSALYRRQQQEVAGNSSIVERLTNAN